MGQIAEFDGTSDVTVVGATLLDGTNFITLSLSPAAFRSWTEEGGDVVAISADGFILTITDVSFSDLDESDFVFNYSGGTIEFDGLPSNTTQAGVFIGNSFGDRMNFSVPGADVFVQGSGGNDTISLTRAGAAFVNGNAGYDQIIVSQLSQNAIIRGGKDDDRLAAILTSARLDTIEIYGDLGSDSIFVIASDQNVIVRGLNDAAVAGDADGDDLITVVGTGFVSMNGNAGSDTLLVAAFNGSGLIRGGQDDDIIDGISIASGTFTFYGDRGDDDINADGMSNSAIVRIYGGNGEAGSTDGDDNLDLSAATENVIGYMNGQVGDDELDVERSFRGNATVRGGQGNDSIRASLFQKASNSILILGDAGDDRIIVTGDNRDYVVAGGGTGDDTVAFIFYSGFASATLGDGQDILVLANTGSTGTVIINDFFRGFDDVGYAVRSFAASGAYVLTASGQDARVTSDFTGSGTLVAGTVSEAVEALFGQFIDGTITQFVLGGSVISISGENLSYDGGLFNDGRGSNQASLGFVLFSGSTARFANFRSLEEAATVQDGTTLKFRFSTLEITNGAQLQANLLGNDIFFV